MSIDRVLIAGYGSIGRRHLRLARSFLPHATIKVLRHQLSEEVPEGSNGCLATLDEAVSFKPNIAVIAGPSSLHVTTALPLANAGVHLLIEKPLDAKLNDIGSLLRVAAQRKVVLLTGYNLRFLPSLQVFRDAVHAGKIGRILSVRCEAGQYLPDWRPGTDYRRSVSASQELGGGVLLELSHEIDYLQWIFGNIVWVNAALTRQSALEINVEDSAQLTLGFESGDENAQLVGTLNMDFFRHDSTRSCVAIGEHGSLRWNGLTGIVDCFMARETDWRVLASLPPARDETYMAEWAHFLQCVRGEASPLVSGEDGYKTVRVVETARESSVRRKTVPVENAELFS